MSFSNTQAMILTVILTGTWQPNEWQGIITPRTRQTQIGVCFVFNIQIGYRLAPPSESIRREDEWSFRIASIKYNDFIFNFLD
jgi:hypothetical protein